MRSWITDFRCDFARYRAYRPEHPALFIFATEQGLWALLNYRLSRAMVLSRLTPVLKIPLTVLTVISQKLVEIITGISLPPRAQIGPGLYIGHFGNIILNPDAVIGATCNISQGVSIGVSGRGSRRGVPVILGSRVYIGANAVIAGKLTISDNAVIAACSLVTNDVPASAVVLGVPAKIVSYSGSGQYIDPKSHPHPGEEELTD